MAMKTESDCTTYPLPTFVVDFQKRFGTTTEVIPQTGIIGQGDGGVGDPLDVLSILIFARKLTVIINGMMGTIEAVLTGPLFEKSFKIATGVQIAQEINFVNIDLLFNFPDIERVEFNVKTGPGGMTPRSGMLDMAGKGGNNIINQIIGEIVTIVPKRFLQRYPNIVGNTLGILPNQISVFVDTIVGGTIFVGPFDNTLKILLNQIKLVVIPFLTILPELPVDRFDTIGTALPSPRVLTVDPILRVGCNRFKRTSKCRL
jgi:hypothetical protein